MKIFLATDHAGYELKNELLKYLEEELNLDVEDCGAFDYDENDDYPEIVKSAIEKLLAAGEKDKAIVIGASGQGEAIAANRFPGVRAVVYYGEAGNVQTDVSGNQLDIIQSSRLHNNANVLSLGARFVETEQAKEAVEKWLTTDYQEEKRHERRISQLG